MHPDCFTDPGLQSAFQRACGSSGGVVTVDAALRARAAGKWGPAAPVLCERAAVNAYLHKRAALGTVPLLVLAPPEDLLRILQEQAAAPLGLPAVTAGADPVAGVIGRSVLLEREAAGLGPGADRRADEERFLAWSAALAQGLQYELAKEGGCQFLPALWPYVWRMVSLGCLSTYPPEGCKLRMYGLYSREVGVQLADELLSHAYEFDHPEGPIYLVHANERTDAVRRMEDRICSLIREGRSHGELLRRLESESVLTTRKRDALARLASAAGATPEQLAALWAAHGAADPKFMDPDSPRRQASRYLQAGNQPRRPRGRPRK